MFTFNRQDYKNILLGYFDFENTPVILPERHASPNELRATSVHEQHHDMLARQTTHGQLIALGVRYEKQHVVSESFNEAIENLLLEGHAIHEAFAVYMSLNGD